MRSPKRGTTASSSPPRRATSTAPSPPSTRRWTTRSSAWRLLALGLDAVSAFSASAACLGNIGPGFGAVGPASNFAALDPFAKLVLVALMLVGRLELYTVLVLIWMIPYRRKTAPRKVVGKAREAAHRKARDAAPSRPDPEPHTPKAQTFASARYPKAPQPEEDMPVEPAEEPEPEPPDP